MAAYAKNPYIAFMRKLQARQGTIMPGFAALYRRKAELDGEDPMTAP